MYSDKAVDQDSDINVDMSLYNSVAPLASAFFKAVVDYNFRAKMFLVLVKYFAICHGLNGTNGLANCGHVYLGIHTLRQNNVIPPFLSEEQISDMDELIEESLSYKIPKNFSRSRATLAGLLIDHFKYYEDFNFTEMAISIRGGSVVT